MTKSKTARLSDSNEPLPVPEPFNPGAWLVGYYRKPVPREAVSALAAIARSPLGKKDAQAHGALLGFFEQVLTDNPWLEPIMFRQLDSSSDDDERRLFALVLAFALRDRNGFEEKLSPASQKAMAAARREKWLVPTPEPLHGAELDVHWGRFFASGRFEPIRELATVLRYHPHRDELQKFRKLAKKPKHTPDEVHKSAVFGAALWSLTSNASQHKLVHDYLEMLWQQKQLTPEVTTLLAHVLQEADKRAATAPSKPPAN